MVLHVVEQVEQLVVVGTVAGLACQFVHVGRPARLADGFDGQRVDRCDAVLPLLGRLVHYVRFGEGPDLSVDALLLLQ